MSTVCKQAVVSGKTVQVVLISDAATAKIYIVDDEDGPLPPRTMSVEQYARAGMSSEEIARHVLHVVSTSIEQLARVQATHDDAAAQSG
ncbi:hypothetical protein K6W16_27835 [Burkholderia dolosa]|jgi:hypothetical protein|uniref:Uncharacterized protein n=1 Tax=Burkholderia dolosa TaxID=152500 RepID=A0A892IDR4_9BURK|nr:MULTISPECIES: hypothetical protein [Burkholderia]AKE05284.1 hypothetical protein XM57_21565 [Burkholderia cepacia]AJY09251.1 hypothetical protein AK34_4771 [Burkholderia dolosa AU0158]AYZ94411.1 hypothetical protein EGY28_04675 [Burkholderia dolosa]ETP63553.1 hypothetical protein BDSB_25410 [Burkholderia dolosa PC543]MBR8061410.1 hypothetical protein [Burkholderia dolosa]